MDELLSSMDSLVVNEVGKVLEENYVRSQRA